MPVKELHHRLTNLICEELARAMASTRKEVKTSFHTGTSQGLMHQLALLIRNLPIAFLSDGPDLARNFHRPSRDHFADLVLRGALS